MDFLYINKLRTQEDSFKLKLSSVSEVFKKRRQNETVIVDNEKLFLSIYGERNSSCHFKRFKNNDFIIVLGTLFYKEEYGSDSLKLLFEDLKMGKRDVYHNLRGSFSVLISLSEKLYIFNDFLGLMRIYDANNGEIISSSFIAIAKMLTQKTLSKQEIFEYIIRGAMYGDRTVLKEINLTPRATLICANNPYENENLVYNQIEVPDYRNFDESIKFVADNYLNSFNVITKHFKNNITSALSGGYDSRLMLALLKKNGILPLMYVYGSDTSKDVQIAKHIAKNEDYDLEHINKEQLKDYSLSNFEEVIENNFYYFDGFNNEGIFDNGTDLLTRRLRSDKSRLHLNGAGGEIWRDFWDLNPREKKTIDFVRHKWDIYDYTAFTPMFDKNEYFLNFSQKVESSINKVNKCKLSRKEMEVSYPFFRNRYWQSIGNSINLRFSHSILPLIDTPFLFQAFDLPMKYKFNGKFEAAIINEIDPKLASYNSNYGHNFTGKVPIKNKIGSFGKRNIPLALKPFLRNLSNRRKNLNLPNYLSNSFIEQVIDVKNIQISDYVNIDSLENNEMISRALTLEYLFNKI